MQWKCCVEDMCSHFQLLEFEGRLVRKLRFHIFNFWNLKEASHESFVFTHHGCNLNVRICTKHCVFSGKRSLGAEKSRLACATVSGVVALAWKCSRIARAVELMGQGVFFFSLMTLCYCLLHMLKHFLHWNCCVQRMCSKVLRCQFYCVLQLNVC